MQVLFFFFFFFKFSALCQVQTSDGSTSPGFELVPSSVTWEIREVHVVSRCLPLGVFSETPSPSLGDFHHPSFILLGSWISLIPAGARSSTTHFVLNRVTT